MNTWPTLDEARSCLKEGKGQGVKVAVLDSGIELAHPLLKDLELADDLAIVEEGSGLGTCSGEGRDVFGHGTAIAGIVRQLAPLAQLGSFRVLGERLRSRTLIIRQGARIAIERGYHILNCSFGCSREEHVLLYKDWIDQAYVSNRHIVAAANNQDLTKREWPGHFPTVITASFTAGSVVDSLFWRRGQLVEFAARGQDLEVPWLGGGIKKVTGSSFAAAHVTGLLARLLSGFRELSPLVAKALLQRLAEPITGGVAPASHLAAALPQAQEAGVRSLSHY
jgi:subtilisin